MLKPIDEVYGKSVTYQLMHIPIHSDPLNDAGVDYIHTNEWLLAVQFRELDLLLTVALCNEQDEKKKSIIQDDIDIVSIIRKKIAKVFYETDNGISFPE